VTWGTSPEQVVSVTGRVPRPQDIADENKRRAAVTSLDYMGLQGGEKIQFPPGPDCPSAAETRSLNEKSPAVTRGASRCVC
jgi:hypothetical protein